MLYLQMVAAFALLVLGAEWLVRGASRLAARCGVSQLLIGLTVVAFGTSAPELAVSLGSALTGRTDLAVGNVVGSNLFNVLFVLGASAIVAPVVIATKLVRLDIPILLAVTVLLAVVAWDGRIGHFDGLLLAGGCVAYTVFSVRLARREPGAEGRALPTGNLSGDIVRIVAGLALLLLGAHWLVEGASELARAFGVSELVIGLTIVAVGTSLPEVATSVVAAVRGEPDLVVGNVVGSNLMNILCILGSCGLVAPHGLPVSTAVQSFDMPVMLGASFALLPVAVARGRLARWEGLFFLLAYVAYTAFLILRSSAHDLLPTFSSVMLGFVLPLVAVTLSVMLVQGLQRRVEGS